LKSIPNLTTFKFCIIPLSPISPYICLPKPKPMKKLLFLLTIIAAAVYGCKKSDTTPAAAANPYDPSKAWSYDTLNGDGFVNLAFHSTNPTKVTISKWNAASYSYDYDSTITTVNESNDTVSFSYVLIIGGIYPGQKEYINATIITTHSIRYYYANGNNCNLNSTIIGYANMKNKKTGALLNFKAAINIP